MSHTLFHDDFTLLVPGRASGYAARGAGWRSSSPNYDVYGATSLFTTVGDLLTWADNFDTPRVGDTSIVRQMSTSAVLLDGDSARQRGRRLVPLDERRFQVEGLPIVHTFGSGLHAGYVASSLESGHHPVAFEWRAPFIFTPGAIAAYRGVYFSAELNATYDVSVVDSTLVLRTGTSGNITARPVFEDTFVSGQLTIEFVRARGHVTGFRITHPRARSLEFTRVNCSRPPS